jgi:hypothetical protein
MITNGLQLDYVVLPADEVDSLCVETFEASQTSVALVLSRRELPLTLQWITTPKHGMPSCFTPLFWKSCFTSRGLVSLDIQNCTKLNIGIWFSISKYHMETLLYFIPMAAYRDLTLECPTEDQFNLCIRYPFYVFNMTFRLKGDSMALLFLFQMFKKLTKQLNGGRLELKYPQHLGTGLSNVNSW